MSVSDDDSVVGELLLVSSVASVDENVEDIASKITEFMIMHLQGR